MVIKEKENDEEKNDDNNYIEEKVKQFRSSYGICNVDFSDEKIIELLKKYNYNFKNTFSGLFK